MVFPAFPVLPLHLILIFVCAYKWSDFIARKGRGLPWRLGFGLIGAVLDFLTYLILYDYKIWVLDITRAVTNNFLDAGYSLEVTCVHLVSAIIVIMLGKLIIGRFVPVKRKIETSVV